MDKILEERLLHVKYEYSMAKFCMAELERENRQAWWNALFAAFVVYWRNGKHFLNGDDDQNTIKAKRYIKRFETSSLKHLEDELNAINPEVLHLGHKRQSEDAKKFGLDGATKLMAWLVENFNKFEAELKDPYKAIWLKEEKVEAGAGTPQATNHIQIINSSSIISNTQTVEFIYQWPKG